MIGCTVKLRGEASETKLERLRLGLIVQSNKGSALLLLPESILRA